MSQCARCGREVPDAATFCDACAGAESSAGTQSAAHPGGVPALEPAPSTTSSARTGGREIAMMAAAAAAGAVLVFAVLAAKGASSDAEAARGGVAAARPAPATPLAIVQKWSTEHRADWLGNQRRGAAFELAADNVVQTWFGAIRPSLVVRCDGRSTDTFVFTRTAMKIEPRANGKTVTVRLDDEPMRTEHWPDSDEHNGIFAPDGAAFAQRLLHAHTFQFGYTPHNSQPVVARFHVDGLEELIAPAAKDCGWKK